MKFGWRYFIAAFICGVATGTKWVGLFFFITISSYILWGFFTKRIDLKKALLVALLFVVIMALAVLASNPILIYESVRESYARCFEVQQRAIKLGYEILYERGLGITNRLSKIYYAHSIVLLLAVFGLIWGIVRNRNRLLNVIILTWAFPFFIYLAFFIALKYQYLMPVYSRFRP